jgi:hypothetical protein
MDMKPYGYEVHPDELCYLFCTSSPVSRTHPGLFTLPLLSPFMPHFVILIVHVTVC